MEASIDLRTWFLTSKRDLPWREDPTPYAVWVSEVMLQQTQVSVVIPYFLHWMEHFPSVKALATASLDEVIKAWEGLGYYSRARNLHEGARYVVEHYDGELPDSWEELSKIKGLGPYTVGAILSFAFHQRVPAVDGNVMRVLTRFFGIEEDIAKTKTIHLIRDRAYALLPEKEPWIAGEALIELGATVCQKQAKCHECPLKEECVAFNNGIVDRLPYKSTKIKYKKLHRTVAVVFHGDALLVRRGDKGKIMNDLHEFPYFEEVLDVQALQERLKDSFELDVTVKTPMKEVQHSFTRYRARLSPYLCKAKRPINVKGYQWLTVNELQKLAFSSGHRRIWGELASANFRYL